MENRDIASAFEQIGDLLELKNENPFKIRAYRRAVEAINSLPRSLQDYRQEGDLRKIPGIGEAISEKIGELLDTGRLKYLQDLQDEFPVGVRELMDIPGVGPKTAARLYRELGVTGMEELETAILDKRVESLPGMGEKTAENLLRRLKSARHKEQRISIGDALPLVEAIIEDLRGIPGLRNLTTAGSLRRWRETIGDIDLIGTAERPEEVMNAFVALPYVREVNGLGPAKSSVIVENGLQVDLKLVQHEAFGSLLQHFTGSKQHNIDLRDLALRKGFSLNEYGITEVASGRMEQFTDEESFYRRLGLEWMPPEIREATGEIEAAATRRLPQLVTVEDVKGDLHAHTEWSDGHGTIEEVARAAMARGYKYLAITDHSVGRGNAGGLSIERLRTQVREVREVDARLEGIKLFTGTEVDIRSDGSLDFPDEILAELDVVVASLHSALSQDEEKATERLIRAIRNPFVTIIGHPTGRIVLGRDPIPLDMEAVLAAARETGTVMEINAHPSRLDLKDVYARRAKELGVVLSIGSDAHSADGFDVIRYGVHTARRAWCSAQDILNCWPLDGLNSSLLAKRKRLGKA